MIFVLLILAILSTVGILYKKGIIKTKERYRDVVEYFGQEEKKEVNLDAIATTVAVVLWLIVLSKIPETWRNLKDIKKYYYLTYLELKKFFKSPRIVPTSNFEDISNFEDYVSLYRTF